MASIEEIYSLKFSESFALALQREQSLLRATTIEKTITNAKMESWNFINSLELESYNTRLEDMNIAEASFDQVWVAPQTYGKIIGLDTKDLDSIPSSPQSEIIQSLVAAANRKIDEVIISAATGIKRTGQYGATSSSFPSGNVISDDGTGLTLSKIIQAKKMLIANNVDVNNTELYLVIGDEQWEDLMALSDNSEFRSFDYNNQKPLANGKTVMEFMGFKIITHTGLTVSSSVRQCLAYARGALGTIWSRERAVAVTKDFRKNDAILIRLSLSFGATRLQDGRIIRVDCAE